MRRRDRGCDDDEWGPLYDESGVSPWVPEAWETDNEVVGVLLAPDGETPLIVLYERPTTFGFARFYDEMAEQEEGE